MYPVLELSQEDNCEEAGRSRNVPSFPKILFSSRSLASLSDHYINLDSGLNFFYEVGRRLTASSGDPRETSLVSAPDSQL